jgi:putative transposase
LINQKETDVKKKRYSEEKIIGILREAEAGMSVADVCRKHGVSAASFYLWRTKYAGMQVSDAKRLRELEDENRRLKRLVADQALDVQLLRELNRKKF